MKSNLNIYLRYILKKFLRDNILRIVQSSNIPDFPKVPEIFYRNLIQHFLFKYQLESFTKSLFGEILQVSRKILLLLKDELNANFWGIIYRKFIFFQNAYLFRLLFKIFYFLIIENKSVLAYCIYSLLVIASFLNQHCHRYGFKGFIESSIQDPMLWKAPQHNYFFYSANKSIPVFKIETLHFQDIF